MTPMESLQKTASTPTEQLIALAASVPPRQVDLSSWDLLEARSSLETRWRPALWLGFCAAVALGWGLGLLMKHRPAAAHEVTGVELVASPDAQWVQDTAGTVSLKAGRLVASRVGDALIRLETPHVSMQAHRSRFLAEVVAGGTFLSVEEGEVVVRVGEAIHHVRAGQSLLWPPSPEIPPQLLQQAAPETNCSEGSEGGLVDCLKAEASGSSLGAQAALFELGSLQVRSGHSSDAIEVWRQSLQRFPTGVLHPEVRVALLVELIRSRRFAEAEHVAREFELTCPDDPRREGVAILRMKAAQR